MKPTPRSKNSPFPPSSTPALAKTRPAGKSGGAQTVSTTRNRTRGASGRVSHTAKPQTASRAAAVANNLQKTDRKPHPSSTSTTESLAAIRADRGTTIALYTLFGALLAGVLYFVAMVFII